jgi:hypothetical protein
MSIDGEQARVSVQDAGEPMEPSARTALGVICGFIVAAWAALTVAVPAAGALMPVIFFLGLSGMMWATVAVWLAVPTTGAIVALRLLWLRRYRGATVWSLVPVAGVILLLHGIEIGDIVNFWLNKARYDVVVADLAHGRCSAEDRKHWKARTIYYECQAPAIVAFEHDRMLSTWRGFVYDASDEIAKPPPERSAAWKHRDIAEFVCDAETQVVLGNHYYIVFGNFGGCD